MQNRQNSFHCRKDGLRFWSEFKKVVNVKMVSELNDTHIEDYEDWVYSKAKQKGWLQNCQKHNPGVTQYK